MIKSFEFSMGSKLIGSCHGLAWQGATFDANVSIVGITFPQLSRSSEECHALDSGMTQSFSRDRDTLKPSIGAGFSLVCHGSHSLFVQIMQMSRSVEAGIYVVRGLAKWKRLWQLW